MNLKSLRWTMPAIAGLAFTTANTARASSHREAPVISGDPAADNTDLFAWVTPSTHDKLTVIANYIPLEEPAGGPNFHKFSDDVEYGIHITRGDSLNDIAYFTFKFTTAPISVVDVSNLTLGPGGGKEFFAQLAGLYAQTVTVTRYDASGNPTVIVSNGPVAPPRIGPRTQAVLNSLGAVTSPTYDDAYAATFINDAGANGRVWAGPRDDGFFVDLGGVFDLANLRPKGTAQDGVSGYNTHSIVLEIPTASLTVDGNAPGNTPGMNTLLGVWASARRPQVSILRIDGTITSMGQMMGVSRLGFPLINEAVIGLQDKDKWNRANPKFDVRLFAAYYLNPIIVRDAAVVGQYSACAPGALSSTCQMAGIDPTPFESGRSDILDVANIKDFPTPNAHHVSLAGTGDELHLDMASDSGFPNGRLLADDVTDVILAAFLSKLTKPISDGVDVNDKAFLTTMPYQALPWQGYDEGHGKPNSTGG